MLLLLVMCNRNAQIFFTGIAYDFFGVTTAVLLKEVRLTSSMIIVSSFNILSSSVWSGIPRTISFSIPQHQVVHKCMF